MQALQSLNPATLEPLISFEALNAEQVAHAYQKAKQAFPSWSQLSYRERGAYLLKAREYILNHLDEIAQTISKNNGKPLVEAVSADILPVCDLIQYFATHTHQLLKPEKISIGVMGWLGRRSEVHYEPLGVVGIISPWNFPFSTPMSGTIMALMAGNCVLLKPADATAAVGFKIEEVLKAANLPEGVFTHLAGGAQTGEALLSQPLDKVVFTGSVKVGKRIMEVCAKQLIPCVLELGGKDAMIVCHDAHLENAAKAAVWGAFCNAGQVCASVERVYVDSKIAPQFIQKVVEKTKQLRQGLGTELNSDIGPLTTEAQLRVVESHIEDAKSRGATILVGGKRHPHLTGYFFEPTVLTDVDSSFRCVNDETFGPLLPIMVFEREEDAVQKANDSIYGLTASVWTRDIKRGKKLAQQIRAGTVMVNECTYSYAIVQTPWGGLKDSGFGRTHGKMGLQELVHLKHIHVNRLPRIQDFWWFGYDEKLYETLKYLCRNLTGNFWQKIKGITRALKETLRKKY